MSFGSDLFRKTVAYVGGNPAEAVLAERDRLRDPEQPLEEDDKLSVLIGEVNNDLKMLFGRQIDLSLRLTSTDSEGVLDAVMPHFQETGRPPLPGRRHGNGIISLQTLVLLMRFGSLRKARGDNFIMLIEEPELHVPPPQQRKLLHYLKKMATQTIITSHSPTVSAVADPHQLVLMVNRAGALSANPLLTVPIDQNATAVRRSLFLTERAATVSAVMHPSVLIPEGKFDASWLRLFGRIADLTELPADPQGATFTHEVGVIPTKDARINETYRDLALVHPTLSCLVDRRPIRQRLQECAVRWSIAFPAYHPVAEQLGDRRCRLLGLRRRRECHRPRGSCAVQLSCQHRGACKSSEIASGKDGRNSARYSCRSDCREARMQPPRAACPLGPCGHRDREGSSREFCRASSPCQRHHHLYQRPSQMTLMRPGPHSD